MRRNLTTWISVLMLISILLAACAPAATPDQATTETVETAAPVVTEEAPATEEVLLTEEAVMTEESATTEVAIEGVLLPEVDPAVESGNIITAGSSTVFPVTERMAERFKDEGFGGDITVDSIGSGAGFERFCVAGESDVANASRAIKEEEVAQCQTIGRVPVEFRVGTDALAVVVNPENNWATNLTLEQLALAFSTATTWADLDPSWPAESILRFSPGSDSGTYDYFVEEVLGDDETLIQNAANIQYSEDDNVLVQGVEGSHYAIGYFGFAYYQAEQDRLTAVSLDGVAPNGDTAEDGSYPLARPLFIYSDATVMQDKPQVAAFINFYLTYVNEELEDIGYFPASAEALDGAKQAWLVAVGQ